VGGQLVPLTFEGLAFIRGCWHAEMVALVARRRVGRFTPAGSLLSPPLGQDANSPRAAKAWRVDKPRVGQVSTVILGGPTMATWVVEVRLTGPNSESKSLQKELDQVKANQLYTETVETLRLRYPDVKP
jgi:hypothetical protein